MSAWLSCNRCSIYVLPHTFSPDLYQHLMPWGWNPVRHQPHVQTLFTHLLNFCTFSLCALCSLLRTLFSVHLSHYGLAISSGVENEVLISLLINLSSPEVPESLPASQNDDWHFYLFEEISVGAKLNFNGSCIPPVRGAIHYWMIVMLFVASVDLWYISCRGPKVGTLGKEAA